VACRFLTFVVIVAFVAGCTSSGGSPSPSPTPPRTSPTSTTSSPEPSQSEPLTTGPNVRPGEKPPEFPDLAKQHTANGAIAFAGYFYRAFDWSYATNDAYLLRKLSLESCRGCASTVRGIDRLADSDAVLRGGRISLLSAQIDHRDFDFRAEYVVDVELDEEAVVIDTPTSAPSTAAARLSRHHALVFLRWNGRGWRVADLTGK
jgi:hypothetical protein